MKEFAHANVNSFIGASFDVGPPCCLFSYCTKGSLQVDLDLLHIVVLLTLFTCGILLVEYLLYLSMDFAFGRLDAIFNSIDN